MFKLKKEFVYLENNTLTGKKLIVGIKECNSYLLIKNEYKESFYSLLEKTSEVELTDKEKELLQVFDKQGYLENGKQVKHSFNEYDQLVYVVVEKKIHNREKFRIIKHEKLFYIIYLFLWLIGGYIWLSNYRVFSDISLKLSDFTLYELAICIVLLPIILNVTHEAAHFLVASCLGVQVDKVSIGVFVTCPTIFLKYKGLNLQPTLKKVVIASAGIAAHFFNLIIGLLFFHKDSSVILIVWIMANIGMIATNLVFIRPNDGYFIITSLIGIYNLRYRGYRYIRSLWHQKKTNSLMDKICGIVVGVFWIISLGGILLTVNYYAEILNLQHKWVYIVTGMVILWLTYRLIKNISQINC